MCYDVKASLETQLKKAKADGNEEAVRQIEEKLSPILDTPGFHLSGFTHPKLLLYTQEKPQVAFWGLIPDWVKERKGVTDVWNKTLNARIETLAEKASFKNSAFDYRCIIYVDGFFEHHYYKGKNYPFFVQRKDKNPMAIACVWNEWFDSKNNKIVNTFAMVTTKGNELMSKLHNSPKLKEARMPYLLLEEEENSWLQNTEQTIEALQSKVSNFPSKDLDAFPVQKLRGKNYLGNVAEAVEPFEYPELEFIF